MSTVLAEGASRGESLLQGLAAFSIADWTLAIAAALIAALLLEVMALVKRAVTSRLPFLILRCTILMVPLKDWDVLYHKVWQPDLHDIMTSKGEEGRPSENIRRYLRALVFAVSLVAGGAILTQLQLGQERRSRQISHVRRLVAVWTFNVAVAGALAAFHVPSVVAMPIAFGLGVVEGAVTGFWIHNRLTRIRKTQ